MPLEYHEPYDQLSEGTREIHRAVQSLIEELEAFDWYLHRIDVSQDAELKEVLEHNMNEEVEHAAMVLEWMRRRIPQFDLQLRTYLFATEPITEIEEQLDAQQALHGTMETGAMGNQSGLGIGSLR